MVKRDFTRRLQPAKLSQILHARRLEREHHFREVKPLDLRQLLWRAFVVLRPRPESNASARRGATRATGALIAAGLRNLLDEQRVDAAIRVVTRKAREAAVNHQPHAVNRDG